MEGEVRGQEGRGSEGTGWKESGWLRGERSEVKSKLI